MRAVLSVLHLAVALTLPLKKPPLKECEVVTLPPYGFNGRGCNDPDKFCLDVTLHEFSTAGPASDDYAYDFERPWGTYCYGLTTGIVANRLNKYDKPEFMDSRGDGKNDCYGIRAPDGSQLDAVTSKDTFDRWYSTACDGSKKIYKTQIQLRKDGTQRTKQSTSAFRFKDDEFFPLDGQGFGDEKLGHNFGFTTEIRTSFTFMPDFEFGFIGDDDIWVFVDRKLAVDLGGIHDTQQTHLNVKMCDLKKGTRDIYTCLASKTGLVQDFEFQKGKNYDMHIFHAERHSVGSDIEFYTTTRLEANPKPPPKIPIPNATCQDSLDTIRMLHLAAGEYLTKSNCKQISVTIDLWYMNQMWRHYFIAINWPGNPAKYYLFYDTIYTTALWAMWQYWAQQLCWSVTNRGAPVHREFTKDGNEGISAQVLHNAMFKREPWGMMHSFINVQHTNGTTPQPRLPSATAAPRKDWASLVLPWGFPHLGSARLQGMPKIPLNLHRTPEPALAVASALVQANALDSPGNISLSEQLHSAAKMESVAGVSDKLLNRMVEMTNTTAHKASPQKASTPKGNKTVAQMIELLY